MVDKTISWNEEAVRNINGLFQSRKERGLTLRELSQLSGVCISDINRYENGKRIPEANVYNKLAQIFGWEKIPEPKKIKHVNRLIIPNPENESEISAMCLIIDFRFEEGHSYQIYTTDKQEKESVKDCVFCYEGKQGIHHMFREVRGKWTRTYTDAQLIGRKIIEVKT